MKQKIASKCLVVFALTGTLFLMACEEKAQAEAQIPANAATAIPARAATPTAKMVAKILLPTPKKLETLGGWLTIGISAAQVRQKLGEPEKGAEMYMAATGTYVQKWRYPDLGLVLQIESAEQGGSQAVGSAGITLVHPGTLQTEQKIGIGSPAQDVRDRYAQLIDGAAGNAETIVVGSVYEGTIFTINQGVVQKIFIGAAAE